MRVLGIDPGSSHSGWCLWEPRGSLVCAAEWTPNELVLDLLVNNLGGAPDIQLVIEKVTPYNGGNHVADTFWWSGRFYQAWRGPVAMVPYREVSQAHTGRVASKEELVHEQLLERFGPVVTAPLELYGKKAGGHMWSAFAVAITWLDLQRA